ncbi:MAG TPA: hypothetical protein VFC19_39035 [Candidatus Limnocylindrales bacterium]|nr:hypothetical protein [Candidatus Limnocylindrales bacterium]
MLKQHIARVAAGATLMAACLVTLQSPAQADYIYCPPDNGACYIVVSGGGNGGDPGNGGGKGGVGKARCLHEQLGEVDCFVGGLGWFNPVDACYYNRLTLPIDDPQWKGNDPGKGNMYAVSCWGGQSAGWERVDVRYLTSPPPGYGGLPSLIDLVLEAIGKLPLNKPAIETAPKAAGAGGIGLVGLPIWLWANGPSWTPPPAFADAPGIRVDATAHVTHMEWQMGDGSTVTCRTAGTKYSPESKDSPSPDCGYKYLRPSREVGGRYTVRATAFWIVDWVGSGAARGQGGQIPVQRFSEVELQINELQVVVQ